MGDRLGEGEANGGLRSAYASLGNVSKAIEYHTQRLALAKKVGDRLGEGEAYGRPTGASGASIIRRGT